MRSAQVFPPPLEQKPAFFLNGMKAVVQVLLLLPPHLLPSPRVDSTPATVVLQFLEHESRILTSQPLQVRFLLPGKR